MITQNPSFSPSDRRSNIAWLVAGLCALALLLFLRSPYVVVHPQFWHEDATVFFIEQRTEGLTAILKPYAGYLLVFPRLVAAIVDWLPLEYAPLLYLIGAYAAWLWVGGLILTSSLFSSARWAFFAALAWVTVPHGGEVFLILTNTQWALGVGLTLLLAEEPKRRGHGGLLLFVATASLTGPFCVLLAPLALFNLWKTQRAQGTVDLIALITLLAALTQVFALVSSSDRLQESASVNVGRFSLFLWIGIFPELFGTQGTYLSDVPLRLSGTLAGILGLAWMTWIAIPGARARRRLLFGAGVILSGALLYILSMHWGVPLAFGMGQRYLFIPFALYVLALISAWSHSQKQNGSLAFAFLLLLAIGWRSSKNFVAPKYWYADWPAACRLLRSGEVAKIQVAPFFYEVTIPARDSLGAVPPP